MTYYDLDRKKRFKAMDEAFNKSLAELNKALTDSESSESEEGEEPRPPKGLRGERGERIDRHKPRGREKLTPEMRAKKIRELKNRLRVLLMEKSMERGFEKRNPGMVSKIEDRINRGEALDKNMIEALGFSSTRELAKAIETRFFSPGELVRDNPVTYTITGKVPGGSTPTTDTTSEAHGEVKNLWGEMSPLTKKIWDRSTRPESSMLDTRAIKQNIQKQGKQGHQSFIPRGQTEPVTYSNQEVLMKIIQRTQQKRQFLTPLQVSKIESMINRGEALNPELLRRIFDENDDGINL